MAYGLQASKVQARIKEEEMQVKVVERQQEIRIQEQEIVRRERELDSKIKKPAEAEKYRLEKIAEADRTKIILQAEAAAEALALKGEAEVRIYNSTIVQQYNIHIGRPTLWRRRLELRLNRWRRRPKPGRSTRRRPWWT